MLALRAPLAVWSNGVKALQSFGLDPMKYAGQMDRMSYLKHDTGETLCDFPLETLYTKASYVNSIHKALPADTTI